MQNTKNETLETSRTGLLLAAFAGLMGGCGKETVKEKLVEPAPPTVTSQTIDKTLNLAKFTADCKARGGLVETHASCSGSNSCKGVSFHKSSGKLQEHTCKAANICAGMSCIDLPSDQGFTGEEILLGTKGSEIQCSFCHSGEANEFVLPVPPGTDITAAAATFLQRTPESQVNAIAFGLHGRNSDGTAYSNMPAFYHAYSRAEIERTVTYLRTLTIKAKEWGDHTL